MTRSPKSPADLVRRYAALRARERGKERGEEITREDGWRRQSYRLPRVEAQETARQWFERYPKAAYGTEVESWRVLGDGIIEFTMRRLPSTDEGTSQG
jgi:hypothetical protein